MYCTCMHMPCTHMCVRACPCVQPHVHVYADCCAHARLSCKTQSPSSRLFVQQQPAAVRLPWGLCHPIPAWACLQTGMHEPRSSRPCCLGTCRQQESEEHSLFEGSCMERNAARGGAARRCLRNCHVASAAPFMCQLPMYSFWVMSA